jgi:hypothetical protein
MNRTRLHFRQIFSVLLLCLVSCLAVKRREGEFLFSWSTFLFFFIATSPWMLHCSVSYKDCSVLLGNEKHNATTNMNHLYSENKTGLKVQCECCVCKIPRILGCPRHFEYIWQLCVAHYCPKTPTKCTRTTRGTSVSPPVAENIDFRGDLVFRLCWK